MSQRQGYGASGSNYQYQGGADYGHNGQSGGNYYQSGDYGQNGFGYGQSGGNYYQSGDYGQYGYGASQSGSNYQYQDYGQGGYGDNQYNDEDYYNQEEIERELYASRTADNDDYFQDDQHAVEASNDADALAMAELEAELDQITEQEDSASSARATLPAGAVPSQNGVLSKHAAEFWFPECRNCECCSGFKHGCSCCTNGVTFCQSSGCGQTTVAAPAAKSSVTVSAPVAPASSTTSGKVIPAGAMPSQNGVLSRYAGEFWFPEARNCSCCNGFKHGCKCCANGVSCCQAAGCTSGEAPATSIPPATSTPAVAASPTKSHFVVMPPDDGAAPASAARVPTTKPTGKVIPAGAMPSQNGVLSRYAGEFWFPEARNCSCCNGFKHGCKCCANGVSCCQAAGCTSGEVPPAISNPYGNAPQYSSGSYGYGAPSAGRAPCEFYRRGNCRFGSSCKNSHA